MSIPRNRDLGHGAGVDGDDSSGNVARLVAEQIFDRVGDVVDLGKLVERAAPRDLEELVAAEG
jgi:hypothetical protein